MEVPNTAPEANIMQSFEPLGASGSARDGEPGRWLTPEDDVRATFNAKLPLPPLLSFPRQWPRDLWRLADFRRLRE